MEYPNKLDEHLRIRADGLSPLVLDLFAGCGGLALGFESAGFRTFGIESNPRAVQTYSHNLAGECRTETLTIDSAFPDAPVIIGGPPCQPFSVGGHQRGLKDSRDGFPVFISAVKQVRPLVWMFENVRGMTYQNNDYLSEILGTLKSLGYQVEYRLLNAKNYGVPQNRQRIFAVGHNADFKWPEASDTVVTAGEALGTLAHDAPEEGRYLTPNMDAYVAKYEKASKCRNPRDLYLDKPARTLTARNLAGATGDMHRIKLPDGRRRMLTVREAARLQSFPDWFEWTCSPPDAYKQIGNAVAPLLAKAMGLQVRECLEAH